MIVLLDPGIGNLSSVQSGFRRVGADTVVVGDAAAWNEAAGAAEGVHGVVLPGVGAFGDAMFRLRASGLLSVVRQAVRDGVPLFGICLGMQLLLSLSEEHGTHVGLGFVPGRVVRFTNQVKVPHMGWNDFTRVSSHPLTKGLNAGDYVYFVHSYYAQLQDEAHLLAAVDYGEVSVPAMIAKGSVMGAQFHPEKSGDVGEVILRNFTRLCTETSLASTERGGER